MANFMVSVGSVAAQVPLTSMLVWFRISVFQWGPDWSPTVADSKARTGSVAAQGPLTSTLKVSPCFSRIVPTTASPAAGV